MMADRRRESSLGSITVPTPRALQLDTPSSEPSVSGPKGVSTGGGGGRKKSTTTTTAPAAGTTTSSTSITPAPKGGVDPHTLLGPSDTPDVANPIRKLDFLKKKQEEDKDKDAKGKKK